MSSGLKLPRTAQEYRADIIKYHSRPCSKTIFQGFIYRLLVELLNHPEDGLSKQFPDLDDHTLAHLSIFTADAETSHRASTYTYSQLQELIDEPLPSKDVGQILFLEGHLPGSWIAAIGAKFGIAPEFYRRHIHLWRASHGAVLYAVPTLPSVHTKCGIPLRINTCGQSLRSLGSLSLASRRNTLPEQYFHTLHVLNPAPGSTYIRGHAFLDDKYFVIEQDISITVESDGGGWTAILWSDVGSRDLLQSRDFGRFLDHLNASTEAGQRSLRLSPKAICGIDSELRHELPDLPPGDSDSSIVLPANHVPRDFHLILDHSIAALDPLYALSPIFRFAAHATNSLLGDVTRRYEIISSTLWDISHSDDNSHRLILQKHLLDDNAARIEQVLRFLRAPHLTHWAERLTPEQRAIANSAKGDVEADYEYLLQRCKEYSEHHHVAIGILVNSTALRKNEKQIRLATQVTKLTILATVFLPLSFCTSIFGMNFVELEHLSIWMWTVVTVVIGIVTFVVYQWDQHSWVDTIKRRISGRPAAIPMESLA